MQTLMIQASFLAPGDEATWLSEETVRQKSPQNVLRSDRHLFEHELKRDLPAVSLYRHSDAFVADSQWICSRGASVPRGPDSASIKRPLCERVGIETILFEQLTLAQATSIVAEADIVSGLHGAGLTNMMWLREGKTVLEIRFSGDTHNNCYFSLASALSLRYYYVLGESVGHNVHSLGDIHHVDVLVDVAALERAVSHAIEGSSA